MHTDDAERSTPHLQQRNCIASSARRAWRHEVKNAGGWRLTPHPYTFRMKRWLLRIVVCLILGAITTVAAAWGCAWLQLESASSTRFPEPRSVNVPSRFVAWYAQRRTSQVPIDAWVYGESLGYGVRERTYWLTWRRSDGSTWSESPGAMHSFPSVIRIDAGWPWFCVSCDRYFEKHWDLPHWTIVNGFEIDGFEIESSEGSKFYGTAFLPCRPVPGGLFADVVFFGSLWFAVFFGFTSAKRFVRAKRGQCPRCGYDLRGQRETIRDQKSGVSQHPHPDPPPQSGAGSPGCPECGWNRAEQSCA